MSKPVKSQLELYMDGLDGVSKGELLLEVKNPDKMGPAGEIRNVTGLGVFALLVIGIFEDSLCTAEHEGCFNTRTININDLFIVCIRRLTQFLLAVHVLRLIASNDTSVSTASWIADRCSIFTFYILVLLPVCYGMVSYWLIRLNKQKLQLAQLNTERMLSVIRRIQLVHMGSSISHPLPPVAKLEETFLRTNLNNETVLSCRDMRSGLLRAMTRLKHTICCGESITTSDKVLVTISHLERLMAEIFHTEADVRLKSQANTLLEKLACLKATCWEVIGYQSKMYRPCNADEEGLMEEAEKRADIDLLWNQCAEWVRAWLSFPLQLSIANAELDVYLQTCKSISGALYDSNVSNNVSNIDSTTDPPHNALCSYAETYLAARQKIARLRATYDDVSTRLWLADQQLCAAPVLKCLLPDHLQTTNSDAGLPTQERVLHLDAALDTLSRNTRTSLSPSPSTLLTHNEVLEGVELLLAGLPTLRDFELLCEDLQLIREATLSGSTPAQYKIYRDSNDESLNKAFPASVTDGANTTNNHTTEAQRRDFITQGIFEANNPTSKASVHPAGATNSLDPTQTSSILDVYTTVIPRRAAPAKKATTDAVDAAVAAQERAQAKKLFRELNQHLRRVHAPSAVSASQPRPSTNADIPDNGTVNQVASPVIPATGCYTQQRVRHIGTSEPESGDFVDEVEVQIETNFTPVDPSALGLCADSDSEPEDNVKEHHEARDKKSEVKAYRVGTIILTDEELRATNLTSSAPSHSALDFQNEMRQALLGIQHAAPFNDSRAGSNDQKGLPLSAFASALRSNHLQEATFGDELSD